MTSSSSSSGNNKVNLISGQKISSKSGSGSNLISGGGSIGKSGSSKSFSTASRDKARFKPSDKLFLGKAADLRKPVESESEKTYKLLAAHASSVGAMGNLPVITPQLVVEGLMKQPLDKKFQIPKLSARINAENTDKRSIDKVDSGSSKSSSEIPIRSLCDSTVSSTSVVPKLDEASNLIGYGTTSATLAALESEGPTNLSMQPGDKINPGMNPVTKTEFN